MYSCRAPSKADHERMEIVKQISAQEYMEYKSYMIRGSVEVHKEVYSFIYDNISYQIERFLNTQEKPSILRVEGHQDVRKEDLPGFLKIKEDITGSLSLKLENPKYFTFFIATEHLTKEEQEYRKLEATLSNGAN